MDNENKKKKMIIISPLGKKTDKKAEELKWKRIARREQREMMPDRHPFAIQGVRNTNVQKEEKSASSIGQEAEKKNQAVADAQKVQSVKDFEVKQNINEAQKEASEAQNAINEKQRIEKEKSEILKILKERKIDYFIHFSNVENIDGILENGIMARGELDRQGKEYKCSDNDRFDVIKDATSLSVSFTNCEMFWQKQAIEGTKWCVFLLDAEKIVKNNYCFYYPHNAALSKNIDGLKRDTAEDFKKMFSPEVVGNRTYNRSEIFGEETDSNKKYATSPQAEIACFGTISCDAIARVLFKDVETYNSYKEKFKAKNITAFALKKEYKNTNADYFNYGPYKLMNKNKNKNEDEKSESPEK